MLQRMCDKCNVVLKKKPYWAIDATGYNVKGCPDQSLSLDLCCACMTSLYTAIKQNEPINKEKEQ